MSVSRQPSTHIVIIALAVLGLIGVQTTMYMSYYYTPTQITPGTLWVVDATGGPVSLYESYRIFFIHLPAAYTTALCCGLTFVGGVVWLLTRKAAWEALIVSAAEVGLAAGAIVLLTGTFWADFAWGSGRIGSGWNWEPRLTTMLILWVSFAALLVLRRAMDTDKQRSLTTAVYGILLGPLYPLVSRAIEIGQTAHPRSLNDLLTATEIGVTRQVATIGIMVAMLSLIALRFYCHRISQRVSQEMMA